MQRKNIAFLGFGTIARIIHKTLSDESETLFNFIGVLDPNLPEETYARLQMLGFKGYHSLEELIAHSPDMVVEASNQEVARKNVPLILAAGIDVLSLSVGAYIDQSILETLTNIQREQKTGRLFLPSGALPGVDVIKAACVQGVESVELITRKPPKALIGAPGFDACNDDYHEVFSGTAREAVKLFPANINIAATLSLAGLGQDKTRVTIIADPTVKMNVHQVLIRGEFGEFEATIRCKPSENPKTSMIAALSAIVALKNVVSPYQIGT